MARLVFLDTTPLGHLCGPERSQVSGRCRAWLAALALAVDEVIIPEVADYEVRRELLHAEKDASLARLDQLCEGYPYLPLTTDAMRLAARFWAEVRKVGQPTADRHALDGDCILAAQAVCYATDGDEVIIATKNVGHLARFPGIDAREWDEIDS